MELADKMFTRSSTTPPHRSSCSGKPDRKYVESLFDHDDWEVFVIKHDEKKGQFDYFTLCCEQTGTNG